MFLGGKSARTHGPLNVLCIHVDGGRLVISLRLAADDFRVHLNRVSYARFSEQHRNGSDAIAHLKTERL
jgi:hypothetical protein